MKTHGTAALNATRELLWARLSDPRLLEDCLPSVEAVELRGPDAFTVWVEPATGLGVTPWLLEVSISDRREREHVRLQGSGHGGEYATSFSVVLDLSSEDDGATAVDWSAEASFDGLLSSLGQRVLPAVLAAQVQRVLQAAASG